MDPALRASDQDRRTAIASLEEHTAAGRLSLDEYDQRVVAALAATTLGDLAAVTRDLPAQSDPAADGAGAAQTEGARHLALAFILAVLTIVVLGVVLTIAR